MTVSLPVSIGLTPGVAARTSCHRKLVSAMNTIVIDGNLVRDPKVSETANGNSRCTFSIAHNERFKNGKNEWVEKDPTFINVVCWQYLADNSAACLTKGMRVVVTGRLEQRSWEDEDGKRNYITELVADDIGASLRFGTVDFHKSSRASAQGTAEATSAEAVASE